MMDLGIKTHGRIFEFKCLKMTLNKLKFELIHIKLADNLE